MLLERTHHSPDGRQDRPLQNDTATVLHHLQVHGPRSRAEIAGGLKNQLSDVSKTLSNMMSRGWIAQDNSTKPASFVLTHKARVKLSTPAKPKRVAREQRVVRAPRLANIGQRAPYEPTEYAPIQRPGANDFLTAPSRFGNYLRYRGGRVTTMAGDPVDAVEIFG